MKRRLALLAISACAARPLPTPTPTSPPPAPPVFAITVRTDPNAEDRVLVDLELRGPVPRLLVFRPAHDVTLAEVSAPHRRDGAATRIDATGLDHVHYALTFPRTGDPAIPVAEPIELRAGGDDLLALPEDDVALPVELHLRPGGVVMPAASSFGLGADRVLAARPAELRHAYFLAGDVGTAVFHTADGDDVAGWLGHTAFDARFVAAELAASRSIVDAWVGRTRATNAPPQITLIHAANHREPMVTLSVRTRGLLVLADRRAPWTATSRILAAQAMMQAYLGGYLRVDDGAFFEEGFSRTAAREALFASGLLDATERAAELNALLAAIAFLPATAERALATARGALVATALDVALAKRGSSLQRFVRERLVEAGTTPRIARAELLAKLRAATDDAFAAAAVATLDRGADLALPADLAGPCYRLGTADLVPFELGFEQDGDRVSKVLAGTRAEAAGVKLGDVVEDIRYVSARATSPVTLIVKRGEEHRTLKWLPSGKPRRGRRFERLAGVPDDRC